ERYRRCIILMIMSTTSMTVAIAMVGICIVGLRFSGPKTEIIAITCDRLVLGPRFDPFKKGDCDSGTLEMVEAKFARIGVETQFQTLLERNLGRVIMIACLGARVRRRSIAGF
uniref:hypothetical protein n=1 Tax=uncultured Roseovarius sp. TaxID=293344 RepID=UPI002604A02D